MSLSNSYSNNLCEYFKNNLWLDFIQIYTEQWLGGHYQTDEMDLAVHGGAGGPLGPPGWGVSDGVVITMQERG